MFDAKGGRVWIADGRGWIQEFSFDVQVGSSNFFALRGADGFI